MVHELRNELKLVGYLPGTQLEVVENALQELRRLRLEETAPGPAVTGTVPPAGASLLRAPSIENAAERERVPPAVLVGGGCEVLFVRVPGRAGKAHNRGVHWGGICPRTTHRSGFLP